jgi:hypothetical protein
MNDRWMKLLLMLIAVGLFANAGALFYLALAPNSAHAADNRLYIEGGKLEVKLEQPVEIRTGYNPMPVALQGDVHIQGTGITGQALNVRIEPQR